jgi:PKD repeat protein
MKHHSPKILIVCWLAMLCITAIARPPKPVAKFTCSPQKGQAPLLVQFTNTSSGQYSQAWMSFGDGANGTVGTTFSHSYVMPGSFTATLTVTGKAGSSSSDTQTITVTNAQSVSYSNVTIAWTGSPSCTYTCYQGTASGNYTRWIRTTNTFCTFSNMTAGVTDYFDATATTNGLTSPRSGELVFTP